MPSKSRHLNDDQLMEVYVQASPNAHVDACAGCRQRFAELASSFDAMRHDAVLEADAVFTPERLHDQRDRIMRRLERHDHPAEVVLFPARASARPTGVHRVLGPARRWVAAAAAAGLAAGMFIGFAIDRQTHQVAVNRVLPGPAEAPIALQRPVESTPAEFLAEIEEALVGSRPRVMRPDLDAIDVMTTPLEIREASYPQ